MIISEVLTRSRSTDLIFQPPGKSLLGLTRTEITRSLIEKITTIALQLGSDIYLTCGLYPLILPQNIDVCKEKIYITEFTEIDVFTQMSNLWLNFKVRYHFVDSSEHRQCLYPIFQEGKILKTDRFKANKIADIFAEFKEESLATVLLILDIYLRGIVENVTFKLEVIYQLVKCLMDPTTSDLSAFDCITSVIGEDLLYSDFYRYSLEELIQHFNCKYLFLNFEDYFAGSCQIRHVKQDMPFEEFVKRCAL